MFHIFRSNTGKWSVLNTETNKVIKRDVESLIINRPVFITSIPGHEKAKESGFSKKVSKSNYFAFIQTPFQPVENIIPVELPKRAKKIEYNPFKSKFFIYSADNQQVMKGKFCVIKKDEIFIG